MRTDNVIKCDCNVIHQDIIDQVKADLPDQNSIQDLAQLFKVFGDPTRVKILSALFKAEMCVCDMASLLNYSLWEVTMAFPLICELTLSHRKAAANYSYANYSRLSCWLCMYV